jgi:SAM-dependent methyltransferase
MRTSRKDQPQAAAASGAEPPVAEVACDEAVFFESFYRANVQADAEDWMTIGSISNPESRFHYNATENSIIRALTRLEPLPPISMARAWRMTRARARLRHLDIGSGTGHWLDFMRSVYLVSESVGVEITDKMSAFLDRKYSGTPGVRIIRSDVVGDGFATGQLGGSFDIVTAIGVMFHIVDDGRWAKALCNLAAVLKPAGVLLVATSSFIATTASIPGRSFRARRITGRSASTSASARSRIGSRLPARPDCRSSTWSAPSRTRTSPRRKTTCSS